MTDRLSRFVWAPVLLAGTVCIAGGCHRHQEHVTTEADVAAAEQDARREIQQAQAEARKDVHSASKVSGGDERTVAQARLTGQFDIAMAKADGDHKVALERCQLADPQSRASCTAKADAEYTAAVAQAKTLRETRAR
jgi:regulator of protease activity HflC (stomatin/prohibitin superfamily)